MTNSKSDQIAELVTCPRCGARMVPHAVAMVGDGYHCECGISCTAEAARAPHVRASYAASKRRAAEAATVPDELEKQALAFCFRAAQGCSGGETRIRKLLFAWHNAAELGGFDLTDLWSLDDDHRHAALTLIGMIARGQSGWYADRYGYEADMEALIETYGPEAQRDREVCGRCGCTRAEHGAVAGMLDGCRGFKAAL